MKAAVVFQPGMMPEYVDNFPEPEIQNERQVLVSVLASAVKNFDRARAGGSHYSTQGQLFIPRIPGGDGVGTLNDGTRVYAVSMNGMIAEKAVVENNLVLPLPEDISDDVAAALPNAVMGSAMAMRFRAHMQKGETVLLNGATGFTGRIAVQIAKHYGAGKIIVTGRNEHSLAELRLLGADEIISLRLSDDEVLSRLQNFHHVDPIDVVIDFLWGSSAELIFSVLQGNGRFTHRTRFVSVGSIAGDTISLSSSILRGTDIQLNGSGLGSWSKDEVALLFKDILPEMFQLAAVGTLKVQTTKVALKDISEAWNMDIEPGRRLVVMI